jgi:amidase
MGGDMTGKAHADVLGDLDGVGIAAAIAAGHFTAREATDAAIARIARLNPTLNFLATDMADAARAQAAAPLRGPLAGVPTLIKDLLPWRGAKLMAGCRALKDYVCDTQGPYADALIAAGLVALGKSTTPEFGFTATTEPLLTGATRNPWNLGLSAGGSSGGAAAAVASGAVPIAHASDGGGSIRIPASACGLVGLKASRGRLLSNGRPEAAISISVDGCVSRTARDTIAWLAATQRTDADRAYEPVAPLLAPIKPRLRIGLQAASLTGLTPHHEIMGALDETAALLARLGHSVRAFKAPIDGEGFSQAFTLNWAAYAAAEINAVLAMSQPNAPLEALFEPLGLGLKMMFDMAAPGAHEAAVATLWQTAHAYAEAFTDLDVILSPVLGAPTVEIGALAPTLPIEEFAARVPSYVAYTPLHNAAGAPALSLPLAMDARGAPIGMMFAGKPGDEATLLALGLELEQAAPWAGRKPAIHA